MADAVALDRLAATRSVPETHRLLETLLATENLSELLPRIQQVASVCTAPPRKAEQVGHILVERLAAHVAATESHPQALATVQQMLLSIFQANPVVAGGVLAAIESDHGDDPVRRLLRLLDVAQPLLVAALVEPAPARAVHKLAVVQTLTRAAWGAQATGLVRVRIARMLLSAVAFMPLATSADAWTVYPALVASTVDMLNDCGDEDGGRSIRAVAQAVVRRVVFGLQHEFSVVALLQSLRELVAAWPRELATSSLVFQLGAVLLHAQVAPREQSLVLASLRELLRPAVDATTRRVYVEALVVPLVAVQATHPKEAPALLQLVLSAAATSGYESLSTQSPNEPSLGVDAAHAESFLALAVSPDASVAWLQSLFKTTTPDVQVAAASLLMQVGACLVDRRGAVRMAALEALERLLQLRRVDKSADWTPSSAKLLVSTLVVLVSFRPASPSTNDQVWLSKCFQVVASLAATTTDTMKIILRLIKRMVASAPKLLSQALHLMLLVWKQDSRVYPHLENLLNQAKDAAEVDDGDDDAEIVRMATILAMCEKDPETGVEWIGDIQAFLEHDAVSIVAMAVRAVTLLCVADCLDYETTVKIFVVKIKKNKIPCVDDPLFQQELCKFYAFGGTCGFVETSPKYSARVLSDLWEYVEADDANVRYEAFAALNGYTLQALELRLGDTSAISAQADEDDGEDELTEQDVEENVERVWMHLETEEDDRVRAEIESLVKRILEAESKQLAPGGASRTGTGVASAAAFAALEQRVSSAATKELKKQMPTRQAVLDQAESVAQWRAYLLAYEPPNVLESSAAVKRRDKRLRVVMGQVDEMKSVLDRSLDASTASLTSETAESSVNQFLWLLQSVDAWNSFGRKYFSRLEELAVLRTPMDAPAGHTEEVLSALIDEQVTALLDQSHAQKWLVIGAIGHQACVYGSSKLLLGTITNTRSALRTQLLQSMEELRVFKDAKRTVDVLNLLIGLVLAYPDKSESYLDAIVPRVLLLLKSESNVLMRAAAILFLAHVQALTSSDDTRTAQLERVRSGVECMVDSLLLSACSLSATDISTSILTNSFDIASTADRIDKSAITTQNNASIVVCWASVMGLAQLSCRLSAIHRLHWLDNLRLLLECLWTRAPTLLPAIALAPIYAESVRHNRVSSTEVQEFASKLQQRLGDVPSDSVAIGVIALPHILRCVATYSNESSHQAIESFLQLLDSSLDQLSAPTFVVAVSNLLHCSTGITLTGAAMIAECEVSVEAATVERALASLKRFKGSSQLALSTTALFALAAIADRVESFVVVQKNKTFDVQITTLPATSLIYKVLEYLRTGGAADVENNSLAMVRKTQSALKCVAHVSRVLPLPIDLATVAVRATSRFAKAEGTLASSIDLAASHASGATLLLSNFLSPERLLNYSPAVLDACVDAVVTTQVRLTEDQLITLLTRSFDALVDGWSRDDSSPTLARAFQKFVKFVGKLVEKPRARDGKVSDEDSDTVSATVANLVLHEFVHRLPFTPGLEISTQSLRLFASEVLSKIASRNSVVESILKIKSTPGETWAWWRVGTLLTELLRLGVVSSSSVVFRWLLQVDLSHDLSSSVVNAFVGDLADAVSTSAGNKPSIEVNEPWLLELLDNVAGVTDQTLRGLVKRRTLFSVIEVVMSWTELRGHEGFVLRGEAPTLQHSAIASNLAALAARALVLHKHERSNASESLARRLWSLRSHAEVVASSVTIMKELHVISSESHAPLLSNDIEKEVTALICFESLSSQSM